MGGVSPIEKQEWLMDGKWVDGGGGLLSDRLQSPGLFDH